MTKIIDAFAGQPLGIALTEKLMKPPNVCPLTIRTSLFIVRCYGSKSLLLVGF